MDEKKKNTTLDTFRASTKLSPVSINYKSIHLLFLLQQILFCLQLFFFFSFFFFFFFSYLIYKCIFWLIFQPYFLRSLSAHSVSWLVLISLLVSLMVVGWLVVCKRLLLRFFFQKKKKKKNVTCSLPEYITMYTDIQIHPPSNQQRRPTLTAHQPVVHTLHHCWSPLFTFCVLHYFDGPLLPPLPPTTPPITPPFPLLSSPSCLSSLVATHLYTRYCTPYTFVLPTTFFLPIFYFFLPFFFVIC